MVKMKNRRILRSLISIFMLFNFLNIGFSHEGEDHSINQKFGSPISPFTYIDQGDNVTGIFVVIFWYIILKGIFELTLVILSRALILEETHRK